MGLNLRGEFTNGHSKNHRKHCPDGKHQNPDLGDLFNLLGIDPTQNIHVIVGHARDVLGCAFSLYNQMDEKNAALQCRSGCDLPGGFPTKTPLEGSICYETTIKGKNKAVVLEDLAQTPFSQSDTNVNQFGLKSYLGFPVHCDGRVIGSLAVLDTRVHPFDDNDIFLISTLAKALSLEEERLRMSAAHDRSESDFQEVYKMPP